jgi:hemoglobin-like flavoprotein
VTLEILMVLFDIAEVEVVYTWNTVYRKMADFVVLKQKLKATE